LKLIIEDISLNNVTTYASAWFAWATGQCVVGLVQGVKDVNDVNDILARELI